MKLVLLLATVLAAAVPVFSFESCECDPNLEIECPYRLVPSGACYINHFGDCVPVCVTQGPPQEPEGLRLNDKKPKKKDAVFSATNETEGDPIDIDLSPEDENP